MLDPDAHITEGFSQQVIETRDGKVHSGVLLEESGLSLTLGLSNAERVVIAKDQMESRTTTRKSAMPSFSSLLDPLQVADITRFLLAQRSPASWMAQPSHFQPTPRPPALPTLTTDCRQPSAARRRSRPSPASAAAGAVPASIRAAVTIGRVTASGRTATIRSRRCTWTTRDPLAHPLPLSRVYRWYPHASA